MANLERNKAVVKKIVEIFAGGDISEINSVDRETIDIIRLANGQMVEHWGAEEWSTQPSGNEPAS
jgi:predicted SnoaL-like aldol condensation-catalyzing enzyme